MNQLELSYLEFYSGIGGWSFALQEALDLLKKQNPNANLSLRRLAAFDHSDLCNHVLRYNDTTNTATTSSTCDAKEGIDRRDTCNNTPEQTKQKKKKRKILQSVSIEMLTTKALQEFNAMIWVMSPPCQPHTRQHSNQNEDIHDPRSKSFLHLCEMISTLGSEYLPKVILLENVVGFEHVSNRHYLDFQIWRHSIQID